MHLCAHAYAYTYTVPLILKACGDTASSEEVDLDSHKMMAAHTDVVLRWCDALPPQYVLAPLNNIAY